ncbi:head-tail connector protein [Streptomyces sp. NPDC048211]|uniref:head-tail connector protein n=1 Tax=Streptomyces sp. NPDC048211 TaxID=3365516 RepID=UPI00371DDD13
MAIGDDYISTEELKTYMAIQSDMYDALIANAISSASREIEKYTHRQFNSAGSATARVFQPEVAYRLHVDDFHTNAGLVIETDDSDDGTFGTLWDVGDYELTPYNGTMNGLPGWPFTGITAVGQKRFRWSRRASVRVTANWGWAEVPDDVKQACFILASDTFQLKDARMGIAGSDQFGQIVRVRDNQIAQNKLRAYVRGSVFVA